MADLALCAPRVLLVEAPGWGEARVRVEGALRRRGWSSATSPADADVLLVVGAPGDRLAEVVERVWDQLPGPRARGAVTTAGQGQDVGAVLDQVVTVLRDGDHQRADAAARSRWSAGDGDRDDMDGMGMSPDGIALAGGDDSDRDGLEMDVLHVPLGPVLPAWPAGLVVRTTLAGDVVTAADVEVLPAGTPAPPTDLPPALLAAALLADRAARLLTLAGAGGPASDLERWCDRLVRDAPDALGGPDEELERIERRVRRSRVLRWSLRGLAPLDAAALAEHGLPASSGGDVHDRLLAMLADARAALLVPAAPWPVAAARGALPALVTGYELATARLVVASLPLDPTAVSPRTTAGAR